MPHLSFVILQYIYSYETTTVIETQSETQMEHKDEDVSPDINEIPPVSSPMLMPPPNAIPPGPLPAISCLPKPSQNKIFTSKLSESSRLLAQKVELCYYGVTNHVTNHENFAVKANKGVNNMTDTFSFKHYTPIAVKSKKKASEPVADVHCFTTKNSNIDTSTKMLGH